MKKLWMVFLLIGLVMVGCEKEDGPKQGEFTDEQIERAYQEIKVSADSILLSEDPIAGFGGMAGEYRKLKEVKNVEAREDGLFVKFTNDEIVGWYIPPEFDYSEMYQVLQKSLSENNVLKSRNGVNKIVCLLDQQDGERKDQTYRDDCLHILDSAFHANGWIVDPKIGPQVTLDFVANHLADYDAIYYIAHGTEYDGKTWIFTNTMDHDLNDWDIISSLLAKVCIKNDDGSGVSLEAHYVFSGDFIKNSYAAGSFTGKCIYMVACQSMGSKGVLNLEMAKAFTDGYGGASAYIGWDETNKTGEGTGAAIYQYLLGGYTLGDACVELAQNRPDLMTNKNKKYDAHLIYYPTDAKDFRLVEPGVISSGSLIAYYPFNGNANDESGNGNHGTVNGSSFVPAKLGQGIYFENSNNSSYYSVKDYFALPQLSLTNFSLGFWVKSYKANNYNNHEASIFSIGDHNDKYFILWCDNNNTGEMFFDYNGTRGERWNIQDDKWHFIAVVKSTETISLYIDNIMVESKPVTDYDFLNQSAYFSYHTWSYSSSSRFYGIIDEARIYNRALSDNEITALYNDGENNNGGGSL